MNMIYLWLIGYAISFILTDVLFISYYIKKVLKISLMREIKPFDCIFCMSFHCANLVYLFNLTTINDAIIFILINLALSKIIAKIWN